jgi:hypothetical protein
MTGALTGDRPARRWLPSWQGTAGEVCSGWIGVDGRQVVVSTALPSRHLSNLDRGLLREPHAVAGEDVDVAIDSSLVEGHSLVLGLAGVPVGTSPPGRRCAYGGSLVAGLSPVRPTLFDQHEFTPYGQARVDLRLWSCP